jgi:hypothetical protein
MVIAMDGQPQFVIHPVAGDKEYLQPLVTPPGFEKKIKTPGPGNANLY